MSSTAELLIEIRADASQAQTAIRSAVDGLNQLNGATGAAAASGKKVQETTGFFGKLGDELGSIGRMAAGMATGMLVANITMGVAERFKDAAEQIDTFGNAVRKVQVVTLDSAENSSRLVTIFERFGFSGDDAASKLSRFERALTGTDTALDLAESGGKRGAQLLQEFGVQTTDAAGKTLPMLNVIENLAGAWEGLDARARNDAARTLFGGLGGGGSEQMNLLLSQGKAGLEAIALAADRYGNTLTQENLDDVKAFTFAHRDMDLALQGVAVQLGASFMPAITATARALAGFTGIVVADLVPLIKSLPDWFGPAVLGIGALSIALEAVRFITAPLWGLVTNLAGAIASAGGAATIAAPEIGELAIAETAAGDAGIASAAGVKAIGAAAATSGLGVAGLTGSILGLVAAAAAMPIAGISFEQGASDSNKKILDNLNADQRAQAQAFIDANAQRIVDAGGGQFTQTGEHLVLQDWLKQNGIDEKALTADKSIASALKVPSVSLSTAADSASVKNATAEKEAADARLKQLQDEADLRKAAFSFSTLDQEKLMLQTKLDQMTAEDALIERKQRLEDLDAAAVDYAQKRLELDQQDEVTRAQIADDALRANKDDRGFQENLLKAELVASHHGGPAVDSAALSKQFRELKTEDILSAPTELIAQHNLDLANRAKSGTDAQARLTTDELDRQKLAIQAAMAPEEANALAQKRAAEDAQRKLDELKQANQISEADYQSQLLLVQAAAKQSDTSLYGAQHPNAINFNSPIIVNVSGGSTTAETAAAIKQGISDWLVQAINSVGLGGNGAPIGTGLLGGARY